MLRNITKSFQIVYFKIPKINFDDIRGMKLDEIN